MNKTEVLNALREYRKTKQNLDKLYDLISIYIANKLNISRTSIWCFNENLDKINCVSIYDKINLNTTSDFVIEKDEYRDYFEAILNNKFINAKDAINHPYTKCFKEFYFQPLNIKSLLDHIIYYKGHPKALICCENSNEIKSWTLDDEQFLKTISEVLSVIFEINQK